MRDVMPRALSAKAIRDAELKEYVLERLRDAWAAATSDHHRTVSAIWYDMGVVQSCLNFALSSLETGDRYAYLRDRPRAHTSSVAPIIAPIAAAGVEAPVDRYEVAELATAAEMGPPAGTERGVYVTGHDALVSFNEPGASDEDEEPEPRRCLACFALTTCLERCTECGAHAERSA